MHMETKIRIGTISMPITAMFVLQLAQNNFIDLDDNLRNIGKSFWNNYVAVSYIFLSFRFHYPEKLEVISLKNTLS